MVFHILILSWRIDTFNTGMVGGRGGVAQEVDSGWLPSLLVLLHEIGVEHAELLHHQLQLVRLREDGAAEMPGAGLLAKSAARNNANA